MGYPYLHDASARKNVHVSNSSRPTHPETHLETLVFVVLVLVAVRFAWWTTIAELCFSVDDLFLISSETQQQTPQANTTDTGTVAAVQQLSLIHI